MPTLEMLEPHDIELVKSSLDAAVSGPFFPEWEFQTLFGLSRDEMREVAQRWPANLQDPVTKTAVLNVLNNLCGYPHKLEGDLENFGLTIETIRIILDKLGNS